MIKSVRFLILICFATVSFTYAQETLSFLKNDVETEVNPDDEDIWVEYAFENKSTKSLTIREYRTNCQSCMSLFINKDKLTYAPGEKGKIRARFRLGTFSGTFDKKIKIWLKDDKQDQPSIQLGVKIIIPAYITVTPKTLTWNQGSEEDAETKILKLEVTQDDPLEIEQPTCTSENFEMKLKEIKKGFSYEIHVTPKDINQRSLGIIRCRTNSEIAKFKRVQAYLVIKKVDL